MTSTNVSNTDEPKLDTNVQYVPIEIPVYRMPVFPTAKEIIPLYPNFDEEVEMVQRTKAITGSTKDKPHMKECSVSLEKMTQAEINAWTKQENVAEFPTFIEDTKGGENTERTTHSVDYQTHETRSRRSTRHRTYENLDIEPEQITKVMKKKKTRVSRTGPTPDRIAARRFHLRNKSKPSQDDQSSKAILPPATEESIKTEATVKPQEVLTKDSTTVKGKLVVMTHGIANRGPQKRNFRCLDCDVIESSRRLLNIHFKEVHDKLFCEECGQVFSTPTGLSRHMYIHTKEDQHPCTHCDEVFPFASDLQSHVAKHITVPGYQCRHGGCKKWFKRKGERDKHARTHTASDLMCDQCTYTTKDIRNLCRHKTRHSDVKKLLCHKCGSMFKWHMELKRHLAKCKAVASLDQPNI